MRLRSALAERSLSPRHAQDLLAAFKLDATKLRYRDWDDLMHYCSYSAMPVGRFVLDVHGESRSTWPANDALCAALQVINHLQDCKEDYLNLDRVYLPLDVLAAGGTTVEALGERARIAGARRLPASSRRTHRAPVGRERCLCGHDRRLAAVARSLGHQHAGPSPGAHAPSPRPAQRTGRTACARHRRAHHGRHCRRAVAAARPSPVRRVANAAGCVSERAHRGGTNAPPAARSITACASCRARSARRCSKSIRSAARSTTLPTIRARAMVAARSLQQWRDDIDAIYRGTPPRAACGPRAGGTPIRSRARGFSSPSSMAWRWTSSPTSARPIAPRSTFIATGSPARSAGCR